MKCEMCLSVDRNFALYKGCIICRREFTYTEIFCRQIDFGVVFHCLFSPGADDRQRPW